MRKTDYAAHREKLIDDEVSRLMSGNSEDWKDNYSPLDAKNFSEFLQEMSTDARDSILTHMTDYHQAPNDVSATAAVHAIGLALVIECRDYWEKLARDRAEREVPSSEELRLCAAEDAADARRDARLEE